MTHLQKPRMKIKKFMTKKRRTKQDRMKKIMRKNKLLTLMTKTALSWVKVRKVVVLSTLNYLPYIPCRTFCGYRISSNNSRGRLFLFPHKKGAIIRGKAIIWGRWLFLILLTGSRALNILFYHAIKSKNNHIKLTEHRLFKCSKFSSLINFHSLNRHWSVLLDHIALTLDREGGGRRLFLIFPFKGGDYSTEGGD